VVNFDGNNEFWVSALGNKVTVLGVGAEFDYSPNDILSSYFDYGVTIVGSKVWGERKSLTANDEISLWDTKDASGNEKYTKSAAKSYTATFWVSFLPVTVSGGLSGELGIH